MARLNAFQEAQRLAEQLKQKAQGFGAQVKTGLQSVAQNPVARTAAGAAFGPQIQGARFTADYARGQVVNPIRQGVSQLRQPGALNKASGLAQAAYGGFSAHPAGAATNIGIGAATGILESLRTRSQLGAVPQNLYRNVTNPASLGTQGLGIQNPYLATGVDVLTSLNPKGIAAGLKNVKTLAHAVSKKSMHLEDRQYAQAAIDYLRSAMKSGDIADFQAPRYQKSVTDLKRIGEHYLGAKTKKLPIEQLMDAIENRMKIDSGYESHYYGRPPKESMGFVAGGQNTPPAQGPKPLDPTTPQLKPELSRGINTAAQILAKRAPGDPLVTGDSPRLFKRIGEGLRSGRIRIEDMPELAKYGLSAEEAADLFEQTATFGGRTLNYLSQTAKQIKALYPKDFEVPDTPPTAWDTVRSLPRNVVNLWRASLVSQLSTAVRNAVSFSGRFTMGALDDAIVGTLETTIGKRTPKQAYAPLLENFGAIIRRFTPEGRSRLQKILEAHPIAADKVLGTPVSDVVMGKYANLITTFNRTQEFFARRLMMDARITSGLIRRGLDPKTIDPNSIPAEVLAEAAEDALKYTFASTPKSGAAADFIKWWNKYPFLNVVGYAFPRFLVNASSQLYEFSPLGVSKFLSPKYQKAILSGSPEGYRVLSRAIVGSLGFMLAAHLRNSEHAGEKWYELNVGGKTVDTRPFGPFLPTYMFIAEALKDPSQFDTKDFLEGTLGIRQIAGTTLFMTSMLSGQGPDDFKQAATELSGNFLGGFTVPLRTFKDFVAQVNPEEGITRATKENPLFGPALGNIPFASQTLPEAPRITRGEPFKSEAPALKQLTGVNFRTKTSLEKEIDRLGIKSNELYPKTGEEKIDRYITQLSGSVIEQVGERLVQNEAYQQMGDYDRKELIKELVSRIKKKVKPAVLSAHSQELATDFAPRMGTTPEEKRAFLLKLKQKGLLTRELLAALAPHLLAQESEGGL